MNTRSRTGRKLRGIIMRTLPLMISCEEFEEFIIDYLEGTLPKRQRIVLDWHLRMCPECRAYLAAYRRTMEVTSAGLDDQEGPLSEAMPEELVQAIIAARTETS